MARATPRSPRSSKKRCASRSRTPPAPPDVRIATTAPSSWSLPHPALQLVQQIAMDGSKSCRALLGTIRDNWAGEGSIDRLALSVAGGSLRSRPDEKGATIDVADPLSAVRSGWQGAHREDPRRSQRLPLSTHLGEDRRASRDSRSRRSPGHGLVRERRGEEMQHAGTQPERPTA